jgi:hypothetical protein
MGLIPVAPERLVNDARERLAVYRDANQDRDVIQ